jgi:hypothetical protein
MMHRRANSRQPYISRNIKNEMLFLRVLIGAFIFSAALIWLSLGHRTQQSESGKATESLKQLAFKLRKSEPAVVAEESNPTFDSRSHIGYRVDWDQKFNPPMWHFQKSTGENRGETLAQLLRLGRASLRLIPTEQNPLVFSAHEKIANAASATASKKVVPILPGERIQLSFSQSYGKARNWKIRLRAVAVTQDRLDSPLPLFSGFSQSNLTKYEIEPKGQPLDIEMPSLSDFEEHEDAHFVLEWPSTASGILFLDGFQPSFIENDSRQSLPRTLMIYVDTLSGDATGLQRTLQVLRGSENLTSPVLFLSQVIPPSDNADVSELSILTRRAPSELGVPLRNTSLRDLIHPQPLLLNQTLEQGGSTRRITVTTDPDCHRECTAAEEMYTQVFDGQLKMERREEFASTSGHLRNDEYLADPGFLYVQMKIPSQTLRLNWESTQLSTRSTASWVFAGVRDLFGFKNSSLKDDEKFQQADIWLSKLIAKFQTLSPQSNIALVIHDNKEPLTPLKSSTSRHIVRGQALLRLSTLSISDAEKNKIVQIDTPVGLMHSMNFFSKTGNSRDKVTLAEKELVEELSPQEKIISQLQRKQVITLAHDGWLFDPLLTGTADKTFRELFLTNPEHAQRIQRASNSEKRNEKLHGLNIKLPATNKTEESIEIHLTTSLNGLGCESLTENAQAKEAEKTTLTGKKQTAQIIVGKRPAHSSWQIFCLLEGKIAGDSSLRLHFKLNQRTIAREEIGLSEFALPLRGFLGTSPDSIEFSGATILDATIANNEPEESLSHGTNVLIWTERIPIGLVESKTHFLISTHARTPIAGGEQNRLSGK